MFQNSITINHTKAEVGQWIKAMRKKHKLSQEELARLLDISRITLQNVESGKNFTVDIFLIILNHFDQLDNYFQFIQNQRIELEETPSLY